MVQLLLSLASARVEEHRPKRDNVGDTPLHIASRQGRLPIVKTLLAVGADILAVNNDGLLPIDAAVREGNSEVAKCLLQHFYGTISCLPLHELLKGLLWIGVPNTNDVPQLRLALDRNVLVTDDVVEILEYLVDRNPAWISARDQDGSLRSM
jgi:hypothetical protein